MTETVWLVERDYFDENLVTLVYATPDGDRHVTQQKSTALLSKQPPTAAMDVDPERLEAVSDEETRQRYADEAERVADRHDPGEQI